MLYILTGPDDFSLNEALEEIKRGLGDRLLLASNTSVLDGKQVTPDQLRAVCQAMPFLAEKRLVIVEGLLERFETRANQAGRKRQRRRRRRQTSKTTINRWLPWWMDYPIARCWYWWMVK